VSKSGRKLFAVCARSKCARSAINRESPRQETSDSSAFVAHDSVLFGRNEKSVVYEPKSQFHRRFARRWTPTEVQRLRELVDAGVPKFQIALILERSTHSIEVYCRRHSMKLVRLKRSVYLNTACSIPQS
jgi:hypothetical protein